MRKELLVYRAAKNVHPAAGKGGRWESRGGVESMDEIVFLCCHGHISIYEGRGVIYEKKI